MSTLTELSEVLELLARQFNPPHRPPRVVAATSVDVEALLEPLRNTVLRDTYLRGLQVPAWFADPAKQFTNDLRCTVPWRRPQATLQAPDVEVWQGHAGSVQSVAFNHDGTRPASAGVYGSVRLWTLQSDGSALRSLSRRTCVPPSGMSADSPP